jgi:anti-sigma B factor antagonist
MFSISVNERGIIVLTGRFDATQVDRAREVFSVLDASAVVDFRDLDYISSAGLGVLLATQQRLKKGGKAIKLVNMNRMVRDVFKIARFDIIFEIE